MTSRPARRGQRLCVDAKDSSVPRPQGVELKSTGVQRRMHRGDSIDYLIVMSGEIDMAPDNHVEAHLKKGGVMVQCGAALCWINRGTEPCVIAVILIHPDPVVYHPT